MTSTPSKATAGPATVFRSKHPHDGEYDYAINCGDALVIAEAFGRAADRDGSILPAEANANIIADTFNVAHETGLTPRQIAEQRADLLAALSRLIEANSYYFPPGNPWGDAARAAISRATGEA